MEGSILRFYVHENDRVHHRLAWEWLLEQANSLGLRGGSAFRAMAGFGPHGLPYMLVACFLVFLAAMAWRASTLQRR